VKESRRAGRRRRRRAGRQEGASLCGPPQQAAAERSRGGKLWRAATQSASPAARRTWGIAATYCRGLGLYTDRAESWHGRAGEGNGRGEPLLPARPARGGPLALSAGAGRRLLLLAAARAPGPCSLSQPPPGPAPHLEQLQRVLRHAALAGQPHAQRVAGSGLGQLFHCGGGGRGGMRWSEARGAGRSGAGNCGSAGGARQAHAQGAGAAAATACARSGQGRPPAAPPRPPRPPRGRGAGVRSPRAPLRGAARRPRRAPRAPPPPAPIARRTCVHVLRPPDQAAYNGARASPAIEGAAAGGAIGTPARCDPPGAESRPRRQRSRLESPPIGGGGRRLARQHAARGGGRGGGVVARSAVARGGLACGLYGARPEECGGRGRALGRPRPGGPKDSRPGSGGLGRGPG
jgi:hypothetical protein